MLWRLLRTVALVSAALPLLAGAATAERRVALIIGNSAYKNVVPLPNPARDAAAVATMFKQAGFEVVESKLDLGNTAMRRVVREFTGIARNADIAVVYYAGHGIEFDGVNYLIPVDAELASDVDVDDETISLDRLMRMLDPVKRLRLVILDACRENPFARKMTRTVASRSIGRGLAKIEVTTTDTLVAFAAKAGMTAADGAGDHSPFTAALLDSLTIPGLDLRIAFGRVRDEVMKSTDNKQEPFVYGSIGGSTIALVPAPAPAEKNPAQPAAAPAPADTLARDYEFAERIGTRQAWELFLATHSTGFLADLARAARDKIIAAEERVASAKNKTAETEANRKSGEAAATRVASAPSAPEATRNETSAMDSADIARLLQFHLKRVGCDPGALDGKWTDQSARALAEFNKREKASFDVKVASLGALDAVKQQKERVCPLVCGKGFKAEEDRCVAEACRSGMVRNKATGECERQPKAATAPAAARDEGGGGGGQIFCSERGGCSAVPKNCRIVAVAGGAQNSGGSSSAAGQRVVCN